MKLERPDASPLALTGRVSAGEVAVLRAGADRIAPPEAIGVARPSLDLLATPATGDELRLPRATRVDGFRARNAVRRMLAADTAVAALSQDAVAKEARMHHLLRGIALAQHYIEARMSHAG